MNTPVPGPPVDGADPVEIRAAVEAALTGPVAGAGTEDLAQQAVMLDELYRTLSAALDTIDRV